MRPIILTSMSRKYWAMSGLTWLNSLIKYNPNVMPCIISEDMTPSTYVHKIAERDVYNSFMALAEEKEKEVDSTNYRWQARRFCHKVFAVEQVARYNEDAPFYWFDADVEFTSSIDFDAIEPPKYGVSCLRRTAWPHSEGGFIGFGYDSSYLIDTWFDFYRTGALFQLKEWHDVWSFDTSLLLCNTEIRNLSADVNLKHVWPETVLAKFSMHHKGPGRKQDAFGTSNAIGNAILQAQDDIKE